MLFKNRSVAVAALTSCIALALMAAVESVPVPSPAPAPAPLDPALDKCLRDGMAKINPSLADLYNMCVTTPPPEVRASDEGLAPVCSITAVKQWLAKRYPSVPEKDLFRSIESAVDLKAAASAMQPCFLVETSHDKAVTVPPDNNGQHPSSNQQWQDHSLWLEFLGL
ncbi:MAG: hypothetical protein BYD32DRAFT_434934 [Podila humilis]|nr:MAG: hypothetical protein BYD32DRAFT_434934 [Podila humilis]